MTLILCTSVYIGGDNIVSYWMIFCVNVVPYTAVYTNCGFNEVFTSAVDVKLF